MARTLAIVLGTAVLYLVTGVVERLLAGPGPHRTTGWWPCGVGVAAVWLAGPRAAIGVVLGELVYVAGFTSAPPWGGLVTGLGNAAEVLLAAALLRRAGYRPELDRPRDVLALLAAAVVSPVGMLAFQVPMSLVTGWPAGGTGTVRAALCWSANDTIGILYVLPLLSLRGWRPPADWSARAEAGLLLVGLAAAGLGFGFCHGPFLPGLTATAVGFLTWAALRFGPPLTALALALYAGVQALLVARGLDPYPTHHWSASFPSLHLLYATAAGTGLMLAASTAARRAAERRLVEAAKWENLGVLTAGLAHELNNKLLAVLAGLDLAELGASAGTTQAAHLNTARQAARYLADRTRLLRAAAGHPLGPAQRVDLGAVVGELAAGVRVAVGPGDLTVSADPELARLAVGHVLANAVEAAGPGGVNVAVGRVDGRVRVRVTDSGPGMTPTVADKAFDLFFSTKFPGRGLGLPVARGVLARAGGTVTVDTAPGRGTVVDLLWPAAG